MLIAEIDEKNCIGCTKCLEACPHDAIIGSMQAMHTVFIEECTGCGSCLPPCPMSCIRLTDSPLPEPRSLAESVQQQDKFEHSRLKKIKRLKRRLRGVKAGVSPILYGDQDQEQQKQSMDQLLWSLLKKPEDKSAFLPYTPQDPPT